ncbi:MAG TPA: hypothetical protein IAB45_00695 [Candidatus Onthousia faecavium]|nr:hypothetical protein [Candidatus Onthousia faecavium]
MMIIAHKSNLYNNKNFIEAVNNLEGLTGVMLDIVMTKDKKVLVFSKVTTNKITINTIQNNNLSELQYYDILSLDDALMMLKNFKGKIIINLLPLNEALLIDDYQKVVADNLNYTEEVKKIIDRYLYLNIYICSSSYNLLYQITKIFINNQKGVILDENSGSYIDVDFYIFIPSMLNEKIMKEQLKLNKEVMIIMEDADDIAIVLGFLEKNKTNKDNYQYITNHAKVFYNTIKNIDGG